MTNFNFQRANTLKAAFQVCNVEPLEAEEIERYYVDLSAVRKTSAIESVSTILDFQEPGQFTTILFTGHRGCGKSTELKAKASGGHVRQLMQMMRTACQTASTHHHPKITAEDVIYAVKQQQFSFERFIPEEHYKFLAQVCLTKNVSKDDIGQLMLFNTSVLEYNGDKRWNYHRNR